MGTAKPVILPSMTFPTRTAAKRWVRDEIKDAYRLEAVVTDPLHDAVLRDLLDRDDDAGVKSGVGLKEFFIRRTVAGTGRIRYVSGEARGIWIRRLDGSEDDWSYTSAIDQEGLVSDVKEALRAVASAQRLAFRERAFVAGPVECALTGALIRSTSDAEVRYRNPSWSQLVAGFVAKQGGFESIKLTSGEGHAQIAGDLADDEQRRAWTAYWAANANPILVKKPTT